MFHNLRAKYFTKYDMPSKHLPEIWQDVMNLIDQNKYEELVNLYKNSQYTNRSAILDIIEDIQNIDQIEKYCKQRFEDYVCCLFMGVAYIGRAANSRGAAIASKTSDQQIDGMYYYADKSRYILLSALDINREDILVFEILSGSLLYIGVDMDEVDGFYNEAKQLQGPKMNLNSRFLNIKTPKWLGSKKILFDFINQACHKLPKGDPNFCLVGIAHYEYYLYLKMNKEYKKAADYMSNKNVKKDIKDACFNFVDHAELNEDTMFAASLFLFFALEYNNKKMAKSLLIFTKLNINFARKPWNYEDEYETKYNAMRYLAGI
ncbi:MAG: hypothetical protein HRU38_05655 [Saccharospirillaceae bacterium]|nr:hypothetical protein [Pseudomonadales bacterium]NRB78142.1 hypothetical protein [Saccharospirillaceae bacterium]